ncbi:hypothetical protein Aph02nite_51930 [Actinoplanes philippinensis]|uniref:Uncharacterized protein n=2 Tax=Actinoplanes philippinensis TaxID=35752 RepID=A0A1I2IKF1_9ACTN|nr:hypothetical protein Aph02nite_51930 [Actinoplanes philippinensis]SFF42795.1 hypothetical protein SAMN05421541_110167 [Actinoplanes philippinensis]
MTIPALLFTTAPVADGRATAPAPVADGRATGPGPARSPLPAARFHSPVAEAAAPPPSLVRAPLPVLRFLAHPHPTDRDAPSPAALP